MPSPSEPRQPANPVSGPTVIDADDDGDVGPASGDPLLTTSLLHSLEREHLLRRPLLLTVLDELAARAEYEPARAMALELLDALDRHAIGDREFVRTVRELRVLVQLLTRLGRSPRSSRTLRRTVEGHAA